MILFFIYEFQFYTYNLKLWDSSKSRSCRYLKNISTYRSINGYHNMLIIKTTRSVGSHNNVGYPVLRLNSICRTREK
jgi:hypothetical protein